MPRAKCSDLAESRERTARDVPLEQQWRGDGHPLWDLMADGRAGVGNDLG